VTQGLDNDTEIIPFTEVEATLNRNYTVENEDGHTDTIREYFVSIGSFSKGNILHYEAYNLYYGAFYNETGGIMKLLYIYDSVPEISLYPVNNTYTNDYNVTFYYEIDTSRGSLYSVEMDFDDGTPITDIMDVETNTSVHYYPQVTGEYNATLYVTINITRVNDAPVLVNATVSTIIYLDFENPTLEITSHTSNDTAITDGYVEVYFDYSDTYAGIERVWIFWDDGVVQNVTDDHFAFHNYVEDGNYTVIMMVEDKAGNQFNSTILFNVVLEVETPTSTSPYATLSILFSLLVTGYAINKKNKTNRK
ncbi:MAG: hypothetical protein GPJ50_07230, partial [Candidatus Heimdallarchaeota archaeon]|nr:hypothetical protein [Candidatus Heimdallarchaeota archaeon]